jgi:hypothetical protein
MPFYRGNGVAWVREGGNDTSDATATREDIKLGKTAYIAEGKVEGTSYIAIELTQAQYNALETKDANTYYLIVPVAYLTFQSPSSFTLKVQDNTKHWNGTLYYSTNLKTWSIWDGTTTLNSVNNKLYLRGTGNTRITGNNQNYRWVLTGSNIECTGNIESLLDWETVESGNHPSMASYCYANLFRDCTALVSAPALPATTLAMDCYRSMFQGCTALVSAPALPATTLADFCYSAMFSGCTALASAPALPATTLATSCYLSMFQGCTALTSAPALPATTLADNCYQYMFYGCTSLTTVPALPATTLANNCYYYMFYGCTALTSPPALPATTLASNCYNSMFQGCTALTSVPALPATTLARGCYSYMFYGCTALTSAPALPATALVDYCYSNMFYECTSLVSAPALPATTLASYCYSSMFEGCRALVSVPALPATTLADCCYSYMFRDCESLKVSSTPVGAYQYAWRIPTSGPGTTASSWNSSMFSGTGGTFTSNPSIDTTYYVENPPVA